MKGFPHVFLARPALAGILLILTSLLTTPARAGGFELGMEFHTQMLCDEMSARVVSEASKESSAKAGAALHLFIRQGRCIVTEQPISVRVAGVEDPYDDADGDEVQLISVSVIDDGFVAWMIVSTQDAKKVLNKKIKI